MPPELKPLEEKGQTPPSSSPLKQIRTYQGDIAEALTRQNESIYSIQAKEHARGGGEAEQVVKSIWPLLVGSLLLITVALFGGYVAYGEYMRKTSPPSIVTPESRFLASESSRDIDMKGLDREALVARIRESAAETKVGELRHISLKEATSTAKVSSFFNTLGTQAPPSLVRALEPAFMLGALGLPGENSGASRFLIFRLTSFPNAFGGMLNWEKSLAGDVGALFNTFDPVKTIAPASVFKDVVYKNKDVRVLYGEGVDAAGATTTAPVLLYSFFDNRMLIITDRLETLQTLIDRLTQDALAR